jgi:uncharacterized protein (DUF58 family)
MLFDGKFISVLETLGILAKRIALGKERGERESSRRGGSVEFADYRAYSTGDELRYVDWNVYARHDQLFLKQFETESNLHASIFLDSSASMAAGGSPRFDAARRFAAALAYIALTSLDTLSLYSYAGDLTEHMSRAYGRRRIIDLLPLLEGLRPEGETAHGKVLGEYRGSPVGHGKEIAVVVSDLLDPAGYRDGFLALLKKRIELNVVHISSGFDFQAPPSGRALVIDIESRKARSSFVTKELEARYAETVREFFAEVETFCRANGISYVRLNDCQSLEEMVVATVRSSRILG